MTLLLITGTLFIAAIAINIAADEEARKTRELLKELEENRL